MRHQNSVPVERGTLYGLTWPNRKQRRVSTCRGDYAPIGQFCWDGGSGTSSYADPNNQLVGLLLTQVGASISDSTRLLHDFWTGLCQALDN